MKNTLLGAPNFTTKALASRLRAVGVDGPGPVNLPVIWSLSCVGGLSMVWLVSQIQFR